MEPLFANGQLYLGMMWRSQKALGLLGDLRFTIHNAVSDQNGTDGEFKIYGRAFDIGNPVERQSYVKALFEKIGFQPGEWEFHCFAIDIQNAADTTLVDHEFQHHL